MNGGFLGLLALFPWYVWIFIALFVTLLVMRWSRSADSATPHEHWRRTSDRWADSREVQDVVCHPYDPAVNGHIILGQFSKKTAVRNRLNESVMVISPSGGGKTMRVIVPTVLRWSGPLVVASVKGDVLALTRAHREQRGPVYVFDPTGISGHVSVRWSPLLGMDSYDDADRQAPAIVATAKTGTLEEADIWEGSGRNLIGALLWCAILTQGSMGTVSDWLGMADMDRRIERILDKSITTAENIINGKHINADSAQPWWVDKFDAGQVIDDCMRARRDYYKFSQQSDRTRSSILLVASHALKAWGSAALAATTDVTSYNERPILDLDELISGNSESTLYIVAPESEQDTYRPVFETIINELLRRIEIKSQLLGGVPITPSLGLFIDEAKNVAALRHLDKVASKARGEGVFFMTIWQDLAQIETEYGPSKAREITANHLNHIYFTGRILDEGTLQAVSRAIGEDTFYYTSTSNSAGSTSTTSSPHQEAVAPISWLRTLPNNEIVVIVSGRKPMLLESVAWFEEPRLRELIPAEVQRTFDDAFAPLPATRKRKALMR